MLGRRAHARAELERKLAGADGSGNGEDVRDLVRRLADSGLVDDGAFATELAESRLARGHGPLRIAADLDAAGVDELLARRVVDGLDPDAIRAAAVRARGDRGGAAAWRRLAGRGFDDETIRALVPEP